MSLRKLAQCLAAGLVIVISTGCATGNTQDRSVDYTMKMYHDAQLVVGSTTRDQLKAILGSPNAVKSLENGDIKWTYIKAVEARAITSDVGTNYVAEFTFSATGALKDKSYSATPMANPLIH
jgi:outer membrane protein assembly factor BamE (lipoprotein component of BamABCDE complex)